MFPLVLLAGGKSERMGSPKGLVPVGATKTPLIVWQLARHKAAGGREAIVVLGHHAEAYLAALPELAGPANGVRVTFSKRVDLGPFASLQAGLAHVETHLPDEKAVFVLPVDVPAGQASTWATLARAIVTGGAFDAAMPRNGARGGHPVLLARAFVKTLLALDPLHPDSRLDVQLHKLPPERLARVDVADPLVLEDLNTPDDVSRFNRG